MAYVLSNVFQEILSKFPHRFAFVFAYGSGVFTQTAKPQIERNMIDFIFVVDDPLLWHKENLQYNSKHYSLAKFGGAEFIKNLQETYGAKVYFNTLVEIDKEIIKYGVIGTNHFIEDLLDWQTLYMSGRLHKPVKVLKKSNCNLLKIALNTNLLSALHTSLLCLPESFTEEQLYLKIAGLSYQGDFRMYFGEDKKKVQNIVRNQMSNFRTLYAESLKNMPLLHWKQNQGIFEQDSSYAATLHRLNLLPRTVQHNLIVRWNKDGRHRDMEDVLQALAFHSECSNMVESAVKHIVWWPSIAQSAKGILTAGIWKSIKYSSKKLKKMIKSIYVKH